MYFVFRYTIASLLLMATQITYAQNFYVVVPVNYPVGNKTFRLDIDSCDSTLLFTCPPTIDTFQYPENQYLDMATDKHNNVWYITGSGNLYRRQLSDTASCRYVGDMAAPLGTTNALVVDSNGVIYAAGTLNGVCSLYKYDSTSGFSTLGTFPKGIISNGDLFFYEHRLFLTAGDLSGPTSLVEVSLPDPSRSCVYMPLGNVQPYGAFSIRNGGTSRAFIVDVNKQMKTSLIEIDIPNRKVLSPLCVYPFVITGAAAYYDLSADSLACTVEPPTSTSVSAQYGTAPYFMVLNPSVNSIRVQTNISPADIISLRLYDISGRYIRNLFSNTFPGQMDISDIADGPYILYLQTNTGISFTHKVIKTGGR